MYWDKSGNKIDRVDAKTDRLKKGAIKRGSILGKWYDGRGWSY